MLRVIIQDSPYRKSFHELTKYHPGNHRLIVFCRQTCAHRGIKSIKKLKKINTEYRSNTSDTPTILRDMIDTNTH